jgi:hypothetical protein
MTKNNEYFINKKKLSKLFSTKPEIIVTKKSYKKIKIGLKINTFLHNRDNHKS